jgi:hypothetical protein
VSNPRPSGLFTARRRRLLRKKCVRISYGRCAKVLCTWQLRVEGEGRDALFVFICSLQEVPELAKGLHTVDFSFISALLSAIQALELDVGPHAICTKKLPWSDLKTAIYLLVKSCCITNYLLIVTMAASPRHLSLSPSPAPSPRSPSFNIWTPLDYLPAQLANSRKRPSHAQLERLQAAFDASPYVTKEERSTLAHEIGLYVYCFIALYLIKAYAGPWVQGRQIHHRVVPEQTSV